MTTKFTRRTIFTAAILSLGCIGTCFAQMTVYGSEDDFTYTSREGFEFGLNVQVCCDSLDK